MGVANCQNLQMTSALHFDSDDLFLADTYIQTH